MTIRADGRWIVWTMTPETARDLARFMRDHVPPRDLALADCDDLEAAADLVDPPRQWTPPGF